MGAWNATPFGNDTACDWVWELEKAKDGALLNTTLDAVIDNPGELEAPECEEGIAAAAVIAAAAKDPVKGVSAEIKSWISSTGYVPSEQVINKAIETLGLIATDSELKELWEEANSFQTWNKKSIEKLMASLNEALDKGLPTRKPKPKSLPRVLYKLMALDGAKADPKIVQKVNEKLSKLKDVNAAGSDTDYMLPLNLAAKFGFDEGVKLLLERGAEVNPKGQSGPSAFTFSVTHGHLDIAQLLLDSGADIFCGYFRNEFGILQNVQGEKVPQDAEVYTFCPALLSVAQSGGTVEAAEYLLERGAELDQWEPNGYTLLHKAAESNNMPLLEWLIDKGADVNVRSQSFEETALRQSISKYEIAKALLEAGTDPNLADRYAYTCLEYAQDHLDQDTVDLLKQYGAKTALELGLKKRAYCLRHAPFEEIGALDREMVYARCYVTEVEFYKEYHLPSVDDVDFLIIMGGPMSVNDEEKYPWLVEEKALIKACIDAGTPVLGICLGAQLVANVLGAEVKPLPDKEIGWYPVSPVDHNKKHVFKFKEEFEPLHWHGETFELPEGAELLAKSKACKNQAFQYGDKVIGLQFHLELYPDDEESLIENCSKDLAKGPYTQTKKELKAKVPRDYRKLQNVLEDVWRYLLDMPKV